MINGPLVLVVLFILEGQLILQITLGAGDPTELELALLEGWEAIRVGGQPLVGATTGTTIGVKAVGWAEGRGSPLPGDIEMAGCRVWAGECQMRLPWSWKHQPGLVQSSGWRGL